LIYDRQDRSTGIAYVTYHRLDDANAAVDQFHGQNALGQPIYLHLQTNRDAPRGPSRDLASRIDSSSRPRSLFDRIDRPVPRHGRARSHSPESSIRHSDVSKPAPEHIDRYVPGRGNRNSDREDSRRRRSPVRRGGRGGRDAGRRPGARREQSRRDESGRPLVQGRPRKTQEELDAEMADYWDNAEGGTAEGATATAAANGDNLDVDMQIE
jgi:THO complex subunit 4